MSFIASAFHKGLVGLGYVVQGAAFVNEVGLDVLNLGLPLPGWARVAVPLAGIVATRLARLLPTDRLEPSKTEPLDNLGPIAGKISGEAFSQASKGPFHK